MASLLILSAGIFTGCSDDDDSRAKATLSSAASLSFPSTSAGTQLITVYADADWTVDAPEWVTVTPAQGTGTTEVTIGVDDNMREGAIDNPRKANITFKGRDLRSESSVLIIQDGDKYRDCQKFTTDQIAALDDESVLEINAAPVVAVTSTGFIIAQNDYNMLCTISSSTTVSGNLSRAEAPVKVGDVVTVKAEKFTDSQKLAYVACDEVAITSTSEITYPEPVDITDNLDSYKADSRTYITVNGILDGSSVKVEGAEYSIQLVDAPASLDLAALNGHVVAVNGYFAGVASPVVRVIPAELIDKGVYEIVYWQEDFEWLAPYIADAAAGDAIGKDEPSANSPAISNAKVYPSFTDTPEDQLIARGYEFYRVWAEGKKKSTCIYLNANYMKFGKTSYQAGMKLPAMEKLGDGVEGAVLSFDWCPMRQGPGTIDPTKLVVIAVNGAEEVQIATIEHNMKKDAKLAWIRAEVPLTGAKFDKDTRIIIRNSDDQWPSSKALRWHIDNIKVSK